MILPLILTFAGLLLVVFGADWLVDGASSVARKARVSEFVIGLTIVGFGTSMPELVVSLTGAIEGNADISVGNVIGSNIMNVLLILGLTALISPIPITRTNMRLDIPLTLAVTVMLLLCGMSSSLFGIGSSDSLSRIEGVVFLLLFASYIFVCFKTGREDAADESVSEKPLFKAIVLIVAGIAALAFGGRLFVDNAVAFARNVGVSDKFIAVTLLAGGTSMPELATCVVAAVRKRGQLALGNILGSNIFNILMILGISATVTPLSFSAVSLIDAGVLLASMFLVSIAAFTGRGRKIDRFDATLMLILEISYLTWLIIKL